MEFGLDARQVLQCEQLKLRSAMSTELRLRLLGRCWSHSVQRAMDEGACCSGGIASFRQVAFREK
eukprot:9468017-Karenia_brevis.AAC.1